MGAQDVLQRKSGVIVSDDLPSNLCCRFRFYETKNLQIPDSTTELTGVSDRG